MKFIYKSGTIGYLQNNQYHRLYDPAVTFPNAYQEWHYHGNLHRLDGPAIIHSNAYQEWFYYDKYINCSSQEQFVRLINLNAFW